MPRTVLDVTRLLTRASYAVATGVDRVELAYARRALAMPAEKVGFAAILGKRAVPLDPAKTRRFIKALDAKWRGVAGDDAAATTLAKRLGGSFPSPGEMGAKTSDDAERAAWAVRASGFLGFRTPATAPGDAYVHVSHLRLDRPEPFQALKRDGARLAVLIHDLIPYRFPEYAKPGEGERHGRRMRTAIETAETLIANSADTARDLAAFAEETGLKPGKILTAPLGLEDGFAPNVAPLQTAKPYFVTLGTIEPRKNHLLLLHVWRRLGDKLGDKTPTLVIVGRRGWENEMIVDLLERSPAIRAHVVETNALSDAALSALIKGARALLFPSFAEGYGLPLAEALALGAPALASDLPAFREIAGDRVDYLDVLDGPAWERAILELSEDASPHRAEALARIAGFAPPDWATHFDIVRPATGLD